MKKNNTCPICRFELKSTWKKETKETDISENTHAINNTVVQDYHFHQAYRNRRRRRRNFVNYNQFIENLLQYSTNEEDNALQNSTLPIVIIILFQKCQLPIAREHQNMLFVK